MKKFLIYISAWVLLVLIVSEATIRIFGLAAKTMPQKNIDGNSMFEPEMQGYWIRGGLKELNKFYSINKQGYNSIIDYDVLNESDLNIALIGDSYIQGLHTDVRHSIGRQLEDLLGPNAVVHEYARAGANIVDYALVYENYIKPRAYDLVFVLATDKDLKKKKASFIGRGHKIPKETITRKIYDNFHLLRYLNINHGLSVHLNDLLNNGPESIEKIHSEKADVNISEKEYLNSINEDAVKRLPESMIFLYEEHRLSDYFLKNYEFDFKEVKHFRTPKDHGIDAHWNINGRYNCAKAMADYIQNIEK